MVGNIVNVTTQYLHFSFGIDCSISKVSALALNIQHCPFGISFQQLSISITITLALVLALAFTNTISSIHISISLALTLALQ